MLHPRRSVKERLAFVWGPWGMKRPNRHLLILAAAQMVSVSGVVAMVTLGGILGRRLAPSPALATLPLSCLVLGIAATTIVAAWCMSRVGRGKGFAIGALTGCMGFLLAAAAMALQSFAVFLFAAVLVGASNAFAQQYRFAAAESAPDRAAQAVSLVLVGALVGAMVGPALATWGEGWMAGAPFAGTFVALAFACLLAAAVLLRMNVPAPAETTAETRTRPLSEIVRQPVFIAAVGGGVAGFGAMNLVMTAAPLSMHAVEGYSLGVAAAVVQAHVVAMYLPSLVTGHLIARFGTGRIMGAGAVILLLMLAAGFAGRQVLHYAAAMIALGVGWNFLYTGGTVLLGQAHRPSERFRAQAVNDFSVFGVSAAASLGAGLALNFFGWHGVLVAAAVPIATATAILTAVRPGKREGPPLAGSNRVRQ